MGGLRYYYGYICDVKQCYELAGLADLIENRSIPMNKRNDMFAHTHTPYTHTPYMPLALNESTYSVKRDNGQ